MSNCVLIIGDSGSGKSTALRTLNPKSTFIINVLGKPLPFKGYKANYKPIKGWDDKEGNYFVSDDYARILRCIKLVNEERPDIKYLVIDDFNYVLSNEFMRRAQEKGFDKFSDLAAHAWMIFNDLMALRPNLFAFVLSHSETDATGYVKLRTIGKLLDEKVKLEGMVTMCLHCLVIDGEHKLLTQNTGVYLAKSPWQMFEDKYIPNDLSYVIQKMIEYGESDE